MALDQEDKEWFSLTLENAQLKAMKAHVDEVHAPLDKHITRVGNAAKREARMLVAGAASVILAWEWVRSLLAGK